MLYGSITYFLVKNLDFEVLGIFVMDRTPFPYTYLATEALSRYIGNGNWHWMQITEAEFGTYRDLYELHEFVLEPVR